MFFIIRENCFILGKYYRKILGNEKCEEINQKKTKRKNKKILTFEKNRKKFLYEMLYKT